LILKVEFLTPSTFGILVLLMASHNISLAGLMLSQIRLLRYGFLPVRLSPITLQIVLAQVSFWLDLGVLLILVLLRGPCHGGENGMVLLLMEDGGANMVTSNSDGPVGG
jgi:hypothetical protein